MMFGSARRTGALPNIIVGAQMTTKV